MLLTAGLFVLTGCTSISEENIPSDITIEELQSRKDKATDPEGRFAKAKSYVIRQQISGAGLFGNMQSKIVELKYKMPDKIKCTISSDGVPESGYIINGSKAWNINYKGKKFTPVAPQYMEQMRTLTLLNTPASNFKDVFKNVKIERCSNHSGSFYKLTCSNNSNNVFEIYIDADKYLTSRIKVSLKLASGTLNSDTTMISYSLYEGVRIADESISVTAGDEQEQKVLYYKLDIPLDDEEFTPAVL